MNNTRKLTLGMGLAMTLALSACSDNDDPPAPGSGTVTPAVPASAGANSGSFVDFLLALASDETSEPLAIGDDFAAPTDDTGEPRPIS